MVISRTPYRVSFFGGGTDYPSWYERYGGSVISAAIDKYAYISVRVLPPFFGTKYRIVYSKTENCSAIDEIEHKAVKAVLKHCSIEAGLEVHHDGDLPARSGTGSSSSFVVGLLNCMYAFDGKMPMKGELAEKAIRIERDEMGENVGSQDQIVAAFGGFNRIGFLVGSGFSIDTIRLPRALVDELVSKLVLVFTGVDRNATEIAEEYMHTDRDKEVILRETSSLVNEAYGLLQDHDIDGFGSLLDTGWKLKKKFSNRISNPLVDDLYNEARRLGALGGKLMGAGGGGFILLYARGEERQRIIETFEKNFVCVPIGFDYEGSKIIYYDTTFDSRYGKGIWNKS